MSKPKRPEREPLNVGDLDFYWGPERSRPVPPLQVPADQAMAEHKKAERLYARAIRKEVLPQLRVSSLSFEDNEDDAPRIPVPLNIKRDIAEGENIGRAELSRLPTGRKPGRPRKPKPSDAEIESWRRQHPGATKEATARAFGISRRELGRIEGRGSRPMRTGVKRKMIPK